MKKLTLIIPAKNESESLPKVLSSLENLDCNIIVSLKDSDVSTQESIKNFKLFIHQQTGVGYGNALSEAINLCKTEWFCIFNADGSFEKNDLVVFLAKREELKAVESINSPGHHLIMKNNWEKRHSLTKDKFESDLNLKNFFNSLP